jgi:hypothetical protein
MLQLLYFTVKTAGTNLLEAGWAAEQLRTVRKIETNIFVLPGIETRSLRRPTPRLVTTPTELAQFQPTDQ